MTPAVTPDPHPTPRVSVIIPYYNAEATLGRTLDSLAETAGALVEVIVVNDRSTDSSEKVAMGYPVVAIAMARRSGAAVARNTGASAARAPILFFLDADVEVAPGTLARVQVHLESPDGPDACFGAYTPLPAPDNFASVYKNIVHHHTHRTSSRRARTFWCGCGAIRAEVFREIGGFDESYQASSVEDIELGYRLTLAGRRILLDPSMTVRHAKRYTLGSLIRSDFWDRAVPWTLLMARKNVFYTDLNLKTSNLLSALALILFPPFVYAAWRLLTPVHAAFMVAAALAVYLGANASLFLTALRHKGALFTAGFVAMHALFYAYSVLGFGVGLALFAWESLTRRPWRK